MTKQLSTVTRTLPLVLVLFAAIMGMGGLARAGAWAGTAQSGSAGAEKVPALAAGNELKAATNAGAALRKSKGGQRSTTQDDRLAAAKRNAARKAAASKVTGRQP
jgi:hypothetical protein